MLRIIGKRAVPSALQVVVAPSTEMPGREVVESFETWYDRFSPVAYAGGIALLPVSFQRTFTVDEYEGLVLLDLDDLSPEDA